VGAEGLNVFEGALPGAIRGFLRLLTFIDEQDHRLAIALLQAIGPSQVEYGQWCACQRIGQFVFGLLWTVLECHGSDIKSVCLNKVTSFPWPVAAWYDTCGGEKTMHKRCITLQRHFESILF
jgi:hypothetical protein